MSKSSIKVYPSVRGYNLAAANYDSKEKYLNSFEHGKILPLFGDATGKSIVDIGAGTGRLSLELLKRGASVTAIDVSEEMLAILKKKANRAEAARLSTLVGDAESIPVPDNTFDFVVAAFLIVHLKDPARFFDEAYRVLKPGGSLVVTNINQKEAPEVKTKEGVIKIESYYHRPEKIRELLAELAFGIDQEIMVKEGDTWVNQIIVASK